MKSTASVNHGKIRWYAHCAGFSVSGVAAGREQLCLEAEEVEQDRASQNTGIEIPTSEDVRMRSVNLPACTALR